MNSKNPKIFLIGYHTKINIAIAKKLRQNGIDILYWVGKTNFLNDAIKDKHNFPNTIFHDVNKYDIVRIVPPFQERIALPKAKAEALHALRASPSRTGFYCSIGRISTGTGD